MSVPPMQRVMLRAEFEKRLSDYSVQMLKAFKTYEQHWNARLDEQEQRTAAIEARIDASWAVKPRDAAHAAEHERQKQDMAKALTPTKVWWQPWTWL